MTYVPDEEDEANYGHRGTRRKGIRWTKTKISICVVLFIISIGLIILGVYPIIDMDYDLKSFANLLFVVLLIFYLFAFHAVKKKRYFIFWSINLVLLDAVSFLFYFYDDIFF